VCRFLIPGLWGIAALATLAPEDLRQLISPQEWATLTAQQAQDRMELLAMPRFLSTFVPVGLMGLLVAAMLAADMSTDSAYMLTWGGVIYNDILAPFRKRAWSEQRGIMVNRFIVACIGLFLLVYGLWYKLEGDLWSYLLLTGAIYSSSMSTLLIACCYWKRANSWGATAAIVAGALIPVLFLTLEKTPATAELAKKIGPNISGIATYAIAWLGMIVGSLLKPQQGANTPQAAG